MLLGSIWEASASREYLRNIGDIHVQSVASQEAPKALRSLLANRTGASLERNEHFVQRCKLHDVFEGLLTVDSHLLEDTPKQDQRVAILLNLFW